MHKVRGGGKKLNKNEAEQQKRSYYQRARWLAGSETKDKARLDHSWPEIPAADVQGLEPPNLTAARDYWNKNLIKSLGPGKVRVNQKVSQN